MGDMDMTYIVYHTASTQQVKVFAAEKDAKRSTTCMNKKAAKLDAASVARGNKSMLDVYAYTDVENYSKNVVYDKTVKNLMTGKDITIRSNTPSSCDPSTELYWSM
jgi:hypothetical protein